MAGNHISILMYHQVGDFPRMDAHRSTYCHYRRFAAQMAYLHRFGYHVLRLGDALDALRGARPIPPSVVFEYLKSRSDFIAVFENSPTFFGLFKKRKIRTNGIIQSIRRSRNTEQEIE